MSERYRKHLSACLQAVEAYLDSTQGLLADVYDEQQLVALINSGASPQRVLQELSTQINARPGVHVGRVVSFGFAANRSNAPGIVVSNYYRDRHMYIVGKTGSGKTNLLRHLISQDVHAGHGLCVVAKEAEFIEAEVLPHIPPQRADDVIYINPGDNDRPISLNPLHLSAGDTLDLKVDDLITVFKQLFGGTFTSRMEELFRQALYTLIPTPHTTLDDLEPLFDRQDPTVRMTMLQQLTNEQTKHFWTDVYPQYPKDAHLPILHRVGKFIQPQAVRNVLCQRSGALHFRKAMDAGKILLFNLSDGILGTQNSSLLGQMVVSKLQLAAMSRADTPQDKRRRFFFYLDEFQTFTGSNVAAFKEILSRARKYKMPLILAHQHLGQIDTSLLAEIYGNAYTHVVFKVNRKDATKVAHEFIKVQSHRGRYRLNPIHTSNGTLSALKIVSGYKPDLEFVQPEELLQLEVGQAYCAIDNQAYLIRTPLFSGKDYKIAEQIKQRSRTLYGVTPQRPRVVTSTPPSPDPLRPTTDVFPDDDPNEVF